jgi:chromosome segregation ATPase
MTDEIKMPSTTEIREVLTNLTDRLARSEEKISRLESENRGWLEIWQRQQFEIDELKADKSQRDSQIQSLRDDISHLKSLVQSP